MDRKESTSGEDSLIARYFRPLATDPGAFDLGDDAAVLKALGDDIVVTTDAIVEGVHFLSDDPPETIATRPLEASVETERKKKPAAPSRRTASPTTMASAVIGRAPALTDWPTAAISTAISRPCRATLTRDE